MMTPHPAYSPDLEHLDFFFLADWRDKILELDEKLLLKVKHLFKELDTTLFRSAFVSWQKTGQNLSIVMVDKLNDSYT